MIASSLKRTSAVSLALLWLLAATPAAAQIVGESVNMVSGTGWPGGDPFLQRQNEPSVAISSVNPQHLLAGANDYRAVDLPNPTVPKMWGDAWPGLFKSFDGGQTWQSILLPGYPQEPLGSPGRNSPLFGFNAGSDPVVRAGTDGMFYYSGIVFNRDTNLGQVFVARFIDLNNKENGDATQALDPIVYLDASAMDIGTSGQFLDKPWLATDIPRAGAGTCTIPTTPARSFPAGNAYFIYSLFTGNSASPSSKIMFTRSLDCGKTWAAPIKLSESNAINQGTTLAVDPRNGDIHAVWRRFATNNQPDAIMYARSTDFGRSFTKATIIATIAHPFDQPGGSGIQSFRANAFPTMAISVSADGNSSWIHVAWTQREAAGSDARIVMSTYDAGTRTWSTPPEKVVDVNGFVDDAGHHFTRGHQVMPALTFNQGLLMLLYYDSHLDHTMGYFTPRSNLTPDPASGRFYTEERAPLGELSTLDDPAVFTPFIDDAHLSVRRHTIDVRVGQATAGPAPSFTSTQVSNFLFGQRGDEVQNLKARRFGDQTGTPTLEVTDSSTFLSLPQLQFNPPNLPIFAKATAAFIGDYIDIAGQTFIVRNGSWAFNTAPSTSALHYAVWTSNQDVRPPATTKADGTYDWSAYTPPNSAITALGTTSTFDPTQTRPACETGNEGTRNQNIYGARISSGLAVTSPQNVKPLSSSIVRAFVVSATNATSADLPFRFSFDAPSGVRASFVNDFTDPARLTSSVDVVVPAHSSVHRSLFVLLASDNGPTAAPVPVHVDQIDTSSPASCYLAGARNPYALCNVRGDPAALRGSLTLNPPGSNPGLVQPEGTEDPIAEGEVYDPLLSASYYQDPTASNLINTNFINSNLVNSNLVNSNLINSNLVNSNFVNSNLVNSNLINSNFVNSNFINNSVVSSAHVSSALASNFVNSNLVNSNLINSNFVNSNFVNSNLINSNFINSNLVNSNLINSNFINATLSDTSYVATNTGNTTHSYHVRIVGKVPKDMPPHALQLVVSKSYTTPLALGCQLVEEPHPAVVATVGNPIIQSPSAFLADPNKPNITDPSATNATLSLAPGESAVITLRGLVEGDDADGTLLRQITSHLSAVVVAHAGGYSSGFLITSDDSNMPRATVGQPYAVTLQATGGRGGNTWSFPADGIPPPSWLKWVNDKAGSMGTLLAAYPDAPGTFTFTVRVTDVTGAYAERELTLIVKPATRMVLSSSSNPSTRDRPVTFTATLTSSGGSPEGTVTFTDNGTAIGTGTLSGGVATATTSSLALGSHDVVASYAGNDVFGDASAALQQTVRADTTTSLVSSSANPSVFGQQVTFTAAVHAVGGGTGTPAGDVTFKDGSSTLGTARLDASGVATFTTSALALGVRSIVASYPGDAASFSPSESSPAFSQTVKPAATATKLESSLNPSTVLASVTFTATVSAVAPGAGTPTGTVTFTDGSATLGTVGLDASGVATFSTSALGLGTHPIVASYAGSGNFSASASSLAQRVDPAPTGITISVSPGSSTYGQPVTFSATVTSGIGTPWGSVTFKDGTRELGTPVDLGASGVATFTFAWLAAGSHTIGAAYQGAGNFGSSAGALHPDYTVAQASTTTSVASSANPSSSPSVTLTATVSAAAPGAGIPTGNVTFKDGATPLGVATLDATGVATLPTRLDPGVRSIVALYGGDTNFIGSDSVPYSQTVRATTITTLASSSNPSIYGQPVTFTATVNASFGTATGTVTFTDGGARLGSVNLDASGVAAWTTSSLIGGAHAIVATYAPSAGSNFVESTSAPLTQSVNGYGFIGFLTPLKTARSFESPSDSGVQKIGSAIPVKWQLTDGTGAFISDLGTALSVSIYKFTCGAWALPDVSKPTYTPYDSIGGAKGNSTFRYGSSTFIFNWDTGAGSGVVPGCYEVVLALKDGTRKATNVQLR